ncbi:MAG: GAF domain-containing protein [Candidatus Kapabacteria bacterium]|nr:GAF domain-containing protein [Candidatus Kapabacteria bacterium]
MEVNQISELFKGERNFIANASNLCAFIFEHTSQINWVGFYFLSGNELILGPFQGKVACIRIPIGKGVCGTAIAEKRTQIVPDVHLFPGHIVCDSASQSEMVIPIFFDGEVIGVLDIDSPIKNRFDEKEEQKFQSFIRILLDSSDVEKIIKYYRNED